MALGAFLSPLIVGVIADRYFSSEKLMAFLHILGGILLLVQAFLPGPKDNGSYGTYFIVSLLYALIYNPTLSLVNSISFAHIPNAERDFPTIRVFGTIGWILVNLFAGFLLAGSSNNHPMILGAVLSFVLAGFSLFLPKTPPTGKKGDPFPFMAAIGLFKNYSFAVFFTVSGFITIALAFYFSNTASYLISLPDSMVPEPVRFYFVQKEEVEVEKKSKEDEKAKDNGRTEKKPEVVKETKTFLNANNTMLLGQLVEMLVLPFLGYFLRWFGMKGVLIVGMLSWGIRYYLFSQMGPFSAVLIGVMLHGVCFDFFFAAGFIHVDNTAPKEIRASAQALFALLTYGLGMWVGSFLSGMLNGWYTHVVDGKSVVDWAGFWQAPALGVFVAVIIFTVFFRIDSSPKK